MLDVQVQLSRVVDAVAINVVDQRRVLFKKNYTFCGLRMKRVYFTNFS